MSVTKLISSLFLICLFLSSCSKDEAGSKDLRGKWTFYAEGELINGVEQLEPYEQECSSKPDYIEFKKDGSYLSTYYDEDCEVDYDRGTYKLSGESLTLISEGDNEEDGETYKVVELSKSTLKLYDTYSFLGNTETDIVVLKK